jgi:hypothetical protein
VPSPPDDAARLAWGAQGPTATSLIALDNVKGFVAPTTGLLRFISYVAMLPVWMSLNNVFF